MCVKRMSIAEPRAARWSELDQLRELTDTVFWSGLMDKYPQLFCEDNVENLRVIEADGKVVSLVAMTQHWASIFGCTVKASCLGAVCTYEAYRGRGFASLLVEDAIRMCWSRGRGVFIGGMDAAPSEATADLRSRGPRCRKPDLVSGSWPPFVKRTWRRCPRCMLWNRCGSSGP
jgi:GNAT superfamily N-acetyltransferase